MRTSFLLLTFVLLIKSGICQFTFKGHIVDSIENSPLNEALITIINAKDSFLLAYTRSDERGNYVLHDSSLAHIQKIHLLFSYPGYATHVSTVLLSGSKLVYTLDARLLTREHLLEEVIVQRRAAAIRFNKDTTEYKADSFWVAKNASAGDLLKQLPGWQIDQDGNIYAFGEKVKQILVDGEEYFSTDPVLVSKIMQADLIDKVQLYERKSDQSVFTGIADNQKKLVVNLKIKADKQKSVFGKASAAVGTDNVYNNEAMINRFNKKSKTAVYGIFSSTGKQGLSSREESSYGNDDTKISFSNPDLLDTWSGTYENIGLPTVSTVGIHHNDKTETNNLSYNFDYRFYDLSIYGMQSTRSEYFLPGQQKIIGMDSQYFHNWITRNRINGIMDIITDSLSSLKITLAGGNAHKATRYINAKVQNDNTGSMISSASSSKTFNGTTDDITPTLLFRQRFRKQGRTLSVNSSLGIFESTSSGYIFNNIELYKPSTSFDTLDQYKTNTNRNRMFQAKAIFTEPLFRNKGIWNLNYGVEYTKSTSFRTSFNKAMDGKYSSIDTAFSTQFDFESTTHIVGSGFSLSEQKITFRGNVDAGLATYTQRELLSKTIIQRHFVNWYPQGLISVSVGKRKSLSVSYTGETIQPKLAQLQPLKDNTDPLITFEGNEYLEPAFNNVLQFTYLHRIPAQSQILLSTLTFNSIHNAFSTNETTDASGRRFVKAINVKGTRSLIGNVQYTFKLNKPDIDIISGLTIKRGRYANTVNGKENIISNGIYTLAALVQKSISDRYDITFRYGLSLNTAVSSLQSSSNLSYYSNDIRFSIDRYLPYKFVAHSDFTAVILPDISYFGNDASTYIWNVGISKKFLKNESLTFQLSVNDILNSNKGINRTVLTNMFYERKYTLLNRYAMLSLSWNFSYVPKK